MYGLISADREWGSGKEQRSYNMSGGPSLAPHLRTGEPLLSISANIAHVIFTMLVIINRQIRFITMLVDNQNRINIIHYVFIVHCLKNNALKKSTHPSTSSIFILPFRECHFLRRLSLEDFQSRLTFPASMDDTRITSVSGKMNDVNNFPDPPPLMLLG